MGLFEGIRSKTNSVPAQLFFALIVLVFVFFGVGGNRGAQKTTYATVNGEYINHADVQRIARFQSQQEQNKDEREKLIQQVIEQMITAESLLQKAQKEGYRSSEYELASQLAFDPSFRENDEFSQSRYLEVIKNMGFPNEVKYEKALNETIMVDKLLANVANSAFISDAALKNLHEQYNTTKEVQFVRISEGVFFDATIEIPQEKIDSILAEQQGRLNEQYLSDLNSKYSTPDTWTYTQVTIDESWQSNGGEAPAPELLSTAQKALEIETIDELLQKPPFQGYLKKSESMSLSRAQIAPETLALLEPLEAGKATLAPNNDSILILEAFTKASEKSFDDVKVELAQKYARDEAASKTAEEFAKQLQETWTDTVPQELLDSKGLSVEESGPFVQGNMTQALSSLASATDALTFIQKSTAIGTAPQAYSIPEGRVVVRITKITPPEASSLKDAAGIYRFQLQQSFLQKYIEEVQQHTSVERQYQPIQ